MAQRTSIRWSNSSILGQKMTCSKILIFHECWTCIFCKYFLTIWTPLFFAPMIFSHMLFQIPFTFKFRCSKSTCKSIQFLFARGHSAIFVLFSFQRAHVNPLGFDSHVVRFCFQIVLINHYKLKIISIS